MLSCWSTNTVGQSEAPCEYEVLQSSEYHRSLECSLHNQTGHSLLVLCSGDTGHHQVLLTHSTSDCQQLVAANNKHPAVQAGDTKYMTSS